MSNEAMKNEQPIILIYVDYLVLKLKFIVQQLCIYLVYDVNNRKFKYKQSKHVGVSLKYHVGVSLKYYLNSIVTAFLKANCNCRSTQFAHCVWLRVRTCNICFLIEFSYLQIQWLFSDTFGKYHSNVGWSSFGQQLSDFMVKCN